MNPSSLVLAVFALLALFGVSGSVTIQKPTTKKPTIKPTARKPAIIKPVNSMTTTKLPRDCTEFKMCTSIEQLIWASDGITCGAFRNKCYLSKANCERWSRNQTALKVTSQQACKPLCPKTCGNEINFRCGQFKKQYKMFVNECDMETYGCKTGETFLPTDISNCGLEETVISETENFET